LVDQDHCRPTAGAQGGLSEAGPVRIDHRVGVHGRTELPLADLRSTIL
jgi:hypothetical protein